MIARTTLWLVSTLLALAVAQEQAVVPYAVPGFEVYPECVAHDPQEGTFFTGSTTDGAIYRGQPGDDAMSVLVPSDEAAIPSAFGLALDGSRLWVAGGPTGRVAVYDAESGETLATLDAPPAEQTMLNDVAIGPDGTAYLTDSSRPVLFAATLGEDGSAEIRPWLDLQGTPIEYRPGAGGMLDGVNLNGIVASEDGGHLLTIQMNTGRLYRISLEDQSVQEVDLGGATLVNGDGLALDGTTLYVVRIANEEIVTVDLADDLASGEVVGRFTHDQLAFPACAAVTDQGLLVVNTQFDQQQSGAPQIPFQLVSFPLEQVRSGTASAEQGTQEGQAQQQSEGQEAPQDAQQDQPADGQQGQDAQQQNGQDEGTKDEPLEQQPPAGDGGDEGQGDAGQQDAQQQDAQQQDAQDEGTKDEPLEQQPPAGDGGDEGQGDAGQQDGQRQDEGGAQAATNEPSPDQLISAGEGIYSNTCVRCHGAEGGGDVGPALAGNAFLQNTSAVVETIAFGRGGMPAFGGTFDHREMAAVVSYIRTAWGNEFGPVTVAQVRQVREGGQDGSGEGGGGQEDAPVGETTAGVRDIQDYSTVTAERLVNPEPENWLNYRRTYDGWGYSPLDQITNRNVGDLELAWTFSTGVTDGHESPPMVNDGIMYVTTPDAKVIALDAVTGDRLWEFQRDLPDGLTQLHPTNRGIGFWGDNVYVATTDARLIALDATTGEPVWDVVVGDPSRGYYITHAPLVVDGKIMVGTSGGELGIRGYIAAYDAEDGTELWKTYTIPGEGEPGNETWPADTWTHGGGSVWMTGTYDPETNVAFWGVGNGAPWIGDARPGDNLWTGSSIAIDVETGEIVDGFQYHWNDSWDWDEVVAPLLIDYQVDGETVDGLVHFARNGYLWWLERTEEGIEFVDAKPYVHQDVFASIDPETGRPVYNQENKATFGTTVDFCPSLWGGRDWPPEAYNPDTGLIYIGANENLCQRMTGRQVAYQPGQSFTGAESQLFVRDGWDHIGEIQAWDVNTREMVWEHHFPESHVWAQMLTTGGNLLFAGGTVDRMFRAFDAETGEVLWEVPTNSGVYGMPVTYVVDGVQYVAVQSGWGVDGTRMQNAIGNAIGRPFSNSVPQGGVVWVFRLPQQQDGAAPSEGAGN